MHTANWGLWAVWMISTPLIAAGVYRALYRPRRNLRLAIPGAIWGLLLTGVALWDWSPWAMLWIVWAVATVAVCWHLQFTIRKYYLLLIAAAALIAIYAQNSALNTHETGIFDTHWSWLTSLGTRKLIEIYFSAVAWLPILLAAFAEGTRILDHAVAKPQQAETPPPPSCSHGPENKDDLLLI